MKIKTLLQNELKRTYHNATLTNKLTTDCDYENDLVDSEIQTRNEMEFQDLKYTCPEILNYGKVYQYGRGGRTVCPEMLIVSRGGSSFRIKSVDDLDLNTNEMKRLYKTLKQFNDYVKSYCSSVVDESIEYIRETYANEIKENQNKKRVTYMKTEYV